MVDKCFDGDRNGSSTCTEVMQDKLIGVWGYRVKERKLSSKISETNNTLDFRIDDLKNVYVRYVMKNPKS